ncbi:MAG: hypothetical protein ACK5Z2_16440 [Bacteroidota bacterium]|jgi:hypothetical protein
MNAAFVLVLFYVWIGAVHALFTGVTTFALLGKRTKTWPFYALLLLIVAEQAFLETYWIGIVDYLGMSLHSGNQNVLSVFGKTASDNLIASLHPGWLSPLLWLLWGLLAYYFGKKIMSRYTLNS